MSQGNSSRIGAKYLKPRSMWAKHGHRHKGYRLDAQRMLELLRQRVVHPKEMFDSVAEAFKRR